MKKKLEIKKLSKLEEVNRGLTWSYREVPYRQLLFTFTDTYNKCQLHWVVLPHANHKSVREIQMAWEIFTMQVKELMYETSN